ncbi:hypothetical protein [Amycolatopsis sp. PS_44_ISF1]|uniref:hypothetical protein n=1 Tax=Amycolatopsis sp. PS_44_ISF1 TaxID=2974917 RepID=UPI0028DD5B93|nr:hypothetical protein [Amycolatopsis sp. PS_44_ISF1]MDT8916228.1 hypothetical protein [Amycolatopsis sp. PS_44_ISF1]
MTSTPLAELHSFGLTRYQTAPLKQGDVTTVEQLAELADEHHAAPSGSSRLASLPGLGAARLQKVLDAVRDWRALQ